MRMPHTPLRLLLALVLPFAAIAQTTVAVPCDLDNTLYFSTTGSTSNGRGSSVFIGVNGQGSRRRALLHFNVAATVPAGARVLAATLTMNVVQSVAFLPVAAHGHRVTRSWGEGTSTGGGTHGGQGVPATTGDATWRHAFYPSTLWTTLGGDFVATPSFVLSMPNLGSTTSTTTAAAVNDVQMWLDTPAQNFGWLMKGADESFTSTAHRLDSRNGGAQPPVLQVTYLLPGQTGAWGTGCAVGANTFQTAFVGAPIGGTTITIAQSNTVPLSIGANYYSLGLDAAGSALGQPGCRLYLQPPILLGAGFQTTASGTATTPLLLPSGFPGVLITCQAAVLDSNPSGFVVSNTALAVLQ